MRKSFVEWAQEEFWRASIGSIDDELTAAEQERARREIEEQRRKERIVRRHNKAWDRFEIMLKNGSNFNNEELKEIERILNETAEMKTAMTLRFNIKEFFKACDFSVVAKKLGWKIRLVDGF